MATYMLLLLLAPLSFVSAENCVLQAPIELSRVVSDKSIYVTVPFIPGNLTEGLSGKSKYRINDFCVGEHTGTHLDAPFHFNEKGWTVAEIPLERLIANGVFLNVSEETAKNSSFRLQASHIDNWISKHGAFPPNAVLLVSYGWAQLYHNRSAYLGTTSEVHKDQVFPGMSEDAAKRLAEIKELVGVGIDTASLDPPNVGNAHTILTANNVYFMEHVDLDQPCLPAKGFKVVSMPMKIERGTGAPLRLIAMPNFFPA